MDVLIVTHFASTFSETDNDRFLYLAKLLAQDNENEYLIRFNKILYIKK